MLLLAITLYLAMRVGHQSFSSVMVLAFLFYRLATRMGEVQLNYQSVAVGESAFWSLQESIRSATEHEEHPGGGVRFPEFSESIEFRDVSFGYSDQPVLDAVNLRIPPV